jgi:hypothetical protein
VGNDPTNETDPSGLGPPDNGKGDPGPPDPNAIGAGGTAPGRPHWGYIPPSKVEGDKKYAETKQAQEKAARVAAARADLIKEIEIWRSKGWVYPANLLQHFLDNSKKNHEINEDNPLNKDEIAQVKAEAHSALKQYIGNYLRNNNNLSKMDGEKIKIPATTIRFTPTFSETPFGYLHAGTKKEKDGTQYQNNILFYAWYGVTVEIEGYIKYDVMIPIKDNALTPVKENHRVSSNQFSYVATKITFTDSFAFPDGIRNLHPLLAAGNELVKAGYYEMTVTATYSDYFSPFIK